jgi:hypothetical protein
LKTENVIRGCESGDKNGSADHISRITEPTWNTQDYTPAGKEFMLQRVLNTELENLDCISGVVGLYTVVDAIANTIKERDKIMNNGNM